MESMRWITFVLSFILCGATTSLVKSGLKRTKRWEGTGDMSNMFRGTAGVDYPDLKTIPTTSFRCADHEYEGGLYADVEAQCQVYHVCHDGRKDSFLCGRGTIFNQQILACDYWYSTECDTAPSFYYLNSQIGNSDSSWRPQAGDSQYNPQPGNQGTDPHQYNPQPGNQGTNSGQYNPQPGSQGTNPGQYNPQPGNQGANPGQYNPQPGNQETHPGQYNPQPGNQETHPGQYNPQPGNQGHNTGQYNPQPGNQGHNTGQYNPQPGNQGHNTGHYNPQPGNQGTNPGQYNPQPGNQGPNYDQYNPNILNRNNDGKVTDKTGGSLGAGQQDEKECRCLKNTYKAPWNFPAFPGSQSKK